MDAVPKNGKRMSVTIKLQFLVLVIMAIIISIQTGLSISNARQRDETEAEQKLMALYKEFNEDITLLEKTAAALSLSYASRPDIQERFKAKDRQGLLGLLEPVFTTLKTDYNIVHLQFHEPSGHIFLRVHAPDQYGDYTFTYRRANAQAIISRQTVAGIEIDPNRLGIQGVSPVFHQGQFVGLVEVGLDYDQAFIEDLKIRKRADYRMWVTQEDAAPAGLGPVEGAPESPSLGFFYYAGTNPVLLPIPTEVYNMVLQGGEPQVQFVSSGDQELAVLVAPMMGYGDRIIGILEISISRMESLTALQINQNTTLTVAGGLALLALTLMWILTNRVVLRPLGHLTAVANRQLEGDLTARVELFDGDEFGQLGHTLNVLTETLENTLKDQEEVITDRTARYRSLFEDSPISLWEEDFSEVKRYIDGLRDSGVTDFRTYFEEHPEVVVRCVDRVKILEVNQATLELTQAKSKEELYAGIGKVFSDESFEVFREELIILAEGRTRFRSEAALKSLVGENIHTAWSLAIAPGYEQTWSRVYVSIEDITERKRALENEKRRREELEILEQVSNTLRIAESEKNMLSLLVRETVSLFHADTGGILAPLTKELEYVTSTERQDLPIRLNEKIAEKQEFFKSLSVGKPVYKTEPSLDPGGALSFVGLPLQSDEKHNWALILSWTERKEFTEEEMRLLNTIADIAGMALGRVQLLESLEQQVADQTQALTTLYELAEISASDENLSSILSQSLEKILVAVTGDAGTIHLLDDERTNLELAAQEGLDPGAEHRFQRIPLKDTFWGKAITEPEPSLQMEISEDGYTPDSIKGVKPISLVTAPMLMRDIALGMISIFHTSVSGPSLDEISLLNLVADQMGNMVERAQLRQHARQTVVIEERQRLARELHDAVTQSLYSMVFLSKASRNFVDAGNWGQVEEHLETLQETAQQVLKEMRLLVFELLPIPLERQGLVGVLSQRLKAVEQRSGMETDIIAEGEFDLPSDIQVGMYRIAQEALNNALKHASATQVMVRLLEGGQKVEMEIEDNGIGFDPDQSFGGLGITSMRERADEIGGKMTIVSKYDQGTKINLVIDGI